MVEFRLLETAAKRPAKALVHRIIFDRSFCQQGTLETEQRDMHQLEGSV